MSNNHGDIVIEAPAGYKWDKGTLTKITYVAEAGGVKYDSLQAAIDAAKAKAVVTMLADTRENVTISTPYNGLMLHASAAALGGGRISFPAPAGAGNRRIHVSGSRRSARLCRSSTTISPPSAVWTAAGMPTARRGAARTASISTRNGRSAAFVFWKNHRKTASAARLSFETMRRAAEEEGL